MAFPDAESTLDTLLDVSDEAILILSPSGFVTRSNRQAQMLFGCAEDELAGCDVRDLLYVGELRRVEQTELPIAPNGDDVALMACLVDGSFSQVIARCATSRDRSSLVILMRPSESVYGNREEVSRLVDEVRRSNDRLRGVLGILSTVTLGGDMGFDEFIGRVTGEVQSIFSADAVLLYLSEMNGFRLVGASDGYQRLGVEQAFVPLGMGVPSLVARSRRTMRLQQMPLDDVGGNPIMLDLDTDARVRLNTELGRACATLIGSPVFSYDHVMAVIVVCWKSTHAVPVDGIPLLDTISNFVSIEFATAIEQFNQERRIELANVLEQVRNVIKTSHGELDDYLARRIAGRVMGIVPAHGLLLKDNPWTGSVMALPLDEVELFSDPLLPDISNEPAGHSDDVGVAVVMDAVRGESPDESRLNAQVSAVTRHDSDDPRDSRSDDSRVEGETPEGASGDEAYVSPTTTLAIREREGLGLPYTFDEFFLNDSSFAMVDPRSPLGLWVARHTNLSSGMLVRLTTSQTAGEIPQLALLLLRGEFEPPFDDTEASFLQNLSQVLGESIASEREHAADTHISQTLQSGLRNKLPEAKGITSASLYLSATALAVVGGDFFDLYTLPDDKVVVIIGDVSGKGVEAAAMASLVKTAIAAYAWDGLPPSQIASAVNTLVANFSRLETFASLIIALVDTRTRVITYCSAGHPPAMLVRTPGTSTAELELLTVQSPVIGAMEGLEYDQGSISYDYGDILFLYTDGTTEARSPDGQFFGEDALRETLLRATRLDVSHVPEAVLGEVAIFAEGNLHDDIAMVALRFDDIGTNE